MTNIIDRNNKLDEESLKNVTGGAIEEESELTPEEKEVLIEELVD